MPMPKASVNEDRLSPGRKRDIRPSRNTFQLDTETIPQPMKQRTHSHFRACIGPSNASHVGTALLDSEPVSHHETKRMPLIEADRPMPVFENTAFTTLPTSRPDAMTDALRVSRSTPFNSMTLS